MAEETGLDEKDRLNEIGKKAVGKYIRTWALWLGIPSLLAFGGILYGLFSWSYAMMHTKLEQDRTKLEQDRTRILLELEKDKSALFTKIQEEADKKMAEIRREYEEKNKNTTTAAEAARQSVEKSMRDLATELGALNNSITQTKNNQKQAEKVYEDANKRLTKLISDLDNLGKVVDGTDKQKPKEALAESSKLINIQPLQDSITKLEAEMKTAKDKVENAVEKTTRLEMTMRKQPELSGMWKDGKYTTFIVQSTNTVVLVTVDTSVAKSKDEWGAFNGYKATINVGEVLDPDTLEIFYPVTAGFSDGFAKWKLVRVEGAVTAIRKDKNHPTETSVLTR